MMDSVTNIQQYLHDHIPLSAAMEVKVVRADEDVVQLAAPLAPNINHRNTVFGGSASALAILAAWTLLHVRLRKQGFGGRIVIHSNTMNYDKPITTDFTASCGSPSRSDWARFEESLRRRGKARIDLSVDLNCREEAVGRLIGSYVALEV